MTNKIKYAILTISLLLSGIASADLARVGPSNIPSPPGHGFPAWYQDLNGQVLDLCLPDATDPGALQQNACLLVGPGVPNPPYNFPTNFPDEAFYYNATSVLTLSSGQRAVLVLALEAAFSTGPVVPGDQVVFTRIRVTSGVPEDGTYTVTHPYGVETFVVSGATGARDITFTEDVGIGAPGVFTGALKSRVGPFLQSATGPVVLNGATFLSDAAAAIPVTGSPFGTNYFEICGVRPDGSPIPLGGSTAGLCARETGFTLMGRLHDFVANPIPSPLEVYNTFYRRDAAGTQVDVYARNVKALPSQPDPVLTAASTNMSPVSMTVFGTIPGQYYTQGLINPAGDLPGPITVINSADVPPSQVTRHAVDLVTVSSSSYLSPNVTIVATSSDKGFGTSAPPTFIVDGFPSTFIANLATPDPADATITVNVGTIPPDVITVRSTAGGSVTVPVHRGQLTITPAAGVPLAQDDTAIATAGGAAITIPVTLNDTTNPTTPITSIQLVGPAIPAGSGTVAVVGTDIVYTPGSIVGTVTAQYTASNATGQSNAANVVITVQAPATGAAPATNPDGPVTVGANQSVVVDVLANDSANGGTIDPASILLSNVTGGTASVVGGKVTFTAGATAGTFGFDYTVANTTGLVSNASHATVNVLAAENLVVISSLCKPINATSGEWRITGTSSISTNNSIQAYTTATVPADLATNRLGASAPVVAGAWSVRARPGPACKTPISLHGTAVGTNVNNVGVTIR